MSALVFALAMAGAACGDKEEETVREEPVREEGRHVKVRAPYTRVDVYVPEDDDHDEGEGDARVYEENQEYEMRDRDDEYERHDDEEYERHDDEDYERGDDDDEIAVNILTQRSISRGLLVRAT